MTNGPFGVKKTFLLLATIAALLPRAAAGEPQRIISFRPNVTEILFALGLGPKVVGVTDFCRYPPKAEKIEKIGGYFNRRLEKILSLKPDLVILVPDATTAKIESALKRSGIETLVLRADSIEDVYDSIEKIAEAGVVSERGKALIARIRTDMEAKSRAARPLSKKKVLLVIQRRPLITAGGGTFLDRLLVLAGGENIAASSKLPYPQFSMEAVVARAPEVIIDFDASDPGDFWDRHASIPAVKNGAVRRLKPDLFVPSPRLPQALQLLIDEIHKDSK